MKTKLLKQIRERYSIDKIISIAKKTDSIRTDYCNHMGFPFFWVNDNKNEHASRGFKLYEDAYTYLKKQISKEYYMYSTHGSDKKEKVW